MHDKNGTEHDTYIETCPRCGNVADRSVSSNCPACNLPCTKDGKAWCDDIRFEDPQWITFMLRWLVVQRWLYRCMLFGIALFIALMLVQVSLTLIFGRNPLVEMYHAIGPTIIWVVLIAFAGLLVTTWLVSFPSKHADRAGGTRRFGFVAVLALVVGSYFEFTISGVRNPPPVTTHAIDFSIVFTCLSLILVHGLLVSKHIHALSVLGGEQKRKRFVTEFETVIKVFVILEILDVVLHLATMSLDANVPLYGKHPVLFPLVILAWVIGMGRYGSLVPLFKNAVSKHTVVDEIQV